MHSQMPDLTNTQYPTKTKALRKVVGVKYREWMIIINELDYPIWSHEPRTINSTASSLVGRGLSTHRLFQVADVHLDCSTFPMLTGQLHNWIIAVSRSPKEHFVHSQYHLQDWQLNWGWCIYRWNITLFRNCEMYAVSVHTYPISGELLLWNGLSGRVVDATNINWDGLKRLVVRSTG